MAADSKVTDGNQHYSVIKIEEIDNCLVGVAGIIAATNMWLDWFHAGRHHTTKQLPTDKDVGFEALVLSDAGLWVFDGMCRPDKLDNKYYAIGTGSQAAMVMLKLGADPQAAVKMAARVDPFTGGRIRVRHLKAAK